MNKIEENYDVLCKSPSLFTEEVLGINTCYAKQKEIMDAVVNHPRVAVRAPNGSGKSWLASFIVVWAMTMFSGVRIVTTASTNRQVRLMWDTIRTVYARSPLQLGGRVLQQEMHFERLGNHAMGYSTDDPGKFEGAHGERTLVIVDEAKSVPQVIFDAVERLLTSGDWVRLLVISSPGSPVGPFYDCFHKNSDLYKCFHISMGDSPFVRKEFIEERKRKWGEKSPLYMSSILGDFSVDADGRIVIPLTYIQRIVEDPPDHVKNRGAAAGIDLAAGGGDESAFSLFHGNQQVALKRWNERDTMVTCGNIIRLFKQYNREYGLQPDNVNIDNGGMGIGVCDYLASQGYHFNRFNFGGNAANGEVYYDAGAEVWYEAGKQIENREISLIGEDTDDGRMSLHDLQCQLSGRMLKPRPDGLIQLESKEEMRKRLLPSPDLADATVLSMVGSRSVELTFHNTFPAQPNIPPHEMDAKSRDEWLREHFRKVTQASGGAI